VEKLLVISNTAHYIRNGTVVGHGPTVQEIDQLAHLFDEVVHLACLHTGKAPEIMLPYQSPRVKFVALQAAGGRKLGDKLKIVQYVPGYTLAILKHLRTADAVHLRCPSNVPMIALVVLSFVHNPRRRWIKYAGNWETLPSNPWSFRFQKWIIRHNFMRGQATVNGKWTGQPEHIHSFINPCLTTAEIEEAERLRSVKWLEGSPKLLFVGNLNPSKGIDRALKIIARLKQRGCDVQFDIAGDGKDRSKYEQQACDLEIEELVNFLGWIPRTELGHLYTQAHFVLLPTDSEGWPKVLSEGMAYGAVPITTNVGAIPQLLRDFKVGRVFEPDSYDEFADAILWYIAHPTEWKGESEKGMVAARQFTYDEFLKAVECVLA